MTLARRGLFAGLAGLLGGCSPATLLNATVSRQGFTREADIAYGSDPRQKLDLYRPDKPRADGKTVIFFYGGSWDSAQQGRLPVRRPGAGRQRLHRRHSRLPPLSRGALPPPSSTMARGRCAGRTDRVGTDKVFVAWAIPAGAHIALLLAANTPLPRGRRRRSHEARRRDRPCWSLRLPAAEVGQADRDLRRRQQPADRGHHLRQGAVAAGPADPRHGRHDGLSAQQPRTSPRHGAPPAPPSS